MSLAGQIKRSPAMSLAGQTALVEARARALPGQGASSAKVTRPFWRPTLTKGRARALTDLWRMARASPTMKAGG